MPFDRAWSATRWAIFSDSSRYSVVSRRRSLRPARLPLVADLPSVYLPVSTPRQWTIGNYADAVIGADWQHFVLGVAAHRIVERLAHDRSIHPHRVAQPHDLGNPSTAKITDPEIARFALADDIAHCADGLAQGPRLVVDMDIVDVDEVGPQPR